MNAASAMNVAPATPEETEISREVLTGLSQSPKQISPKYFYDQKGSQLFDAITELDEYYVPRVEKEIFAEHLDAMCTVIGAGRNVVEPGAGSCAKIRWLLPELNPASYVPMDISGEHLEASARNLSTDYPGLEVAPQVCDHTRGLSVEDVDAPVFFYPGSSVGNFEPAAAVKFMRQMRGQMDDEGGLLIGVDAKKDRNVLRAAYDDAEGVTAEFNINVLNHLNQLLDGDIDAGAFDHVAMYNEDVGRIEMHLRCTDEHTATLAGQPVAFEEGEMIHTENSYKYHPQEFMELAEQAGFAHRELWQDSRGWFSVMYFEPA